MALDLKEACRVCWNASSHKPKPQLSFLQQTLEDKKTKTRVCKMCKYEWKPLTICKTSGGKWVQIRPVPGAKVREYELCNTFKRGACVKGTACSFAHSLEELQAWNQAKREELVKLASRPRPSPPANSPVIGENKMCMHVLNTGTCPYGMNCYYAHSEEEIELWNESMLRDQRSMRGPDLEGVKVRKRPPLNFNNSYRLCMHVEKGNRCVFGNACIFAHSLFELDEWNRQLRDAAEQSKLRAVPEKAPRHMKQRYDTMVPRVTQNDVFSSFPPLTSSYSDSVEAIPMSGSLMSDSNSVIPVWTMDSEGGNYEDESGTGDPPFVEIVREELANSGIQIHELVKMKKGVSISEINGKPLSLTWSREDPVEWSLRVLVADSQVLCHVVLLDARFPEFRICGIDASTSGKPSKVLVGNCNLMGVALQKRINPRDYVDVKILFRPSSGFFTQTVIFKFDGFFIGTVLAVKMLDEIGEPIMDNSQPETSPSFVMDPDVSSRSLFWEEHYQVIPFEVQVAANGRLPHFHLPDDTEEKLRSSAFDSMDKTMTIENYRERLHQLLYIEEYQQRMDFSRYDMYDEVVQFVSKFVTDEGHMEMSNPDEKFVELKMNELLLEGATSVRTNDMALLRPMGQQQAYKCKVHKVMREKVLLRVKGETVTAIQAQDNKVDIRFSLNRIPMRIMHHAVDLVDLTVLFPDPTNLTQHSPTLPLENEASRMIDAELNPSQQLVVRSILQSTYKRLPSLLCGPFGTGKTRTLQEALILLITAVPDSRVLVCTHSNSAADLYVEKVHQVWQERYRHQAPLVRIYFKDRNRRTIPEDVLPYCWTDRKTDLFGMPPLDELQGYRVVVTTTVTSYDLVGVVPVGYFTHVLVDEAAQAMEAEALIPLATATGSTKLVLAGDPMQLEAPVQSDIARQFHLNRSLLERLYDMPIYTTTVAGITCRTALNENYRSVKEIIDLASSIFYNNELKAVRSENVFTNGLTPLRFVGVKGTEEQDDDSPSFYNNFEAAEVVNQVSEMVLKGLQMEDICVLSPYTKQVQHIRFRLRSKKLGGVKVFRIENVQGLEYKALILSTVRTCTQVPEDIGTESLGFLANPRLFNTAITRAKDYLVVVGDPYTLASVGENRGCWIEFIGRCRQMKSFVFKDNDAFDRTLEASIQTRHLAQVSPSKQPQVSAAPSADTSKLPNHVQRPAALDILRKAPEKARKKVLADRLFPLVKKTNETLAHPITGNLICLPIEEVFELLMSPPLLAQKVQDLAAQLKRNRIGSSSETVQPATTSQRTAAVPHTETTVQASVSSQNVVSKAVGQVSLSSASGPVGQGASVGQEQDAGGMSRVATQGQSVLWLLQTQLDCLNEHERQLRAELQRIRAIWPFQSSHEEQLLQQQLNLLQQQKAAIQKQYTWYKDYLVELKNRDEQHNHQTVPTPVPEMTQPSATVYHSQSVQNPIPSPPRGSTVSSVSSVPPPHHQPHSMVRPTPTGFQIPKLGTTIGQQTGQPQPQPQLQPQPQPQPQPHLHPHQMNVRTQMWNAPQEPVPSMTAPYKLLQPVVQPQLINSSPGMLPAHTVHVMGHPGPGPGAIGTGRNVLPTNPVGATSQMPAFDVPFVYGATPIPFGRAQVPDPRYQPSGPHQQHHY